MSQNCDIVPYSLSRISHNACNVDRREKQGYFCPDATVKSDDSDHYWITPLMTQIRGLFSAITENSRPHSFDITHFRVLSRLTS